MENNIYVLCETLNYKLEKKDITLRVEDGNKIVFKYGPKKIIISESNRDCDDKRIGKWEYVINGFDIIAKNPDCELLGDEYVNAISLYVSDYKLRKIRKRYLVSNNEFKSIWRSILSVMRDKSLWKWYYTDVLYSGEPMF